MLTKHHLFDERGYYGGHTDVYKPYGKEMYYYDVNSFVIPLRNDKAYARGKTCMETCQAAIWSIYLAAFFVEAKIECPDTMKIPLLPYKDPYKGTYFLSFPFLSFPFLSFPFLSFPFLSFPFLQGRLQASTLRKS